MLRHAAVNNKISLKLLNDFTLNNFYILVINCLFYVGGEPPATGSAERNAGAHRDIVVFLCVLSFWLRLTCHVQGMSCVCSVSAHTMRGREQAPRDEGSGA